MMKNVEILAPAGSYESLKAAIAAGADAVYVGGVSFGARAYANNLTEEQLLEAIDYVHLHNRKIYLTINTLLKEKELEQELYSYLLPYYKQGIDAVIVQDIGVLQYVKKTFPDLPIHASTQMTITNLLGAQVLEELGVERVVTAREMQLSEIEKITKHTKLEIESFVHGALCYCYSGQCLYSSLLGGRSGNRGQCAQPCRLPYRVNQNKNESYVLSLKDICTLEYIPELLEAGIYSLKIEGRMKKPEYVALVTKMYRKYVDLYLTKGKEGYFVKREDKEQLMDLYNRGGFYGGYYFTKNGREMLSLQRPNHAGVPAIKVTSKTKKALLGQAIVPLSKGDIIEMPNGENYTLAEGFREGQKVNFYTQKDGSVKEGMVLNRTRNEQLINCVKETIIDKKIKETIQGYLQLSVSKPAMLSVSYQDLEITVYGDLVEQAVNQPLDEARIEKQMRKTGNTEFSFGELEVVLEGNLFISMQALNELRRKALEQLADKILDRYRRKECEKIPSLPSKEKNNAYPILHVYVEEYEQWEAALSKASVRRIYVDCNIGKEIWNGSLLDLVKRTHEKKKEVFLCMPHIFREATIQSYQSAYGNVFEIGLDGVLIRNYESFEFLKQNGYDGKIVTDYNLYQFNRRAKQFWNEQGIESLTAPLELNEKELRDVGLENSELIVYGYYPMMISAQCIQKTTEGCKKQRKRLNMQDRYRKTFTVKNQCDYCYNIIYNTAPVVLLDQKDEIRQLAPKALRLHFTLEPSNEVIKILELYEKVFLYDEEDVEFDGEFTRGHFKRGVK